MTEQADALRSLIEDIEAGNNGKVVFALAECCAFSWYVGALAKDAYNGSLDAAKTLHDALVPVWEYAIYSQNDSYQWFAVQLETPAIRVSFFDEPISGISDNPARAWLIAILRAKLAEIEA